jgi:lipopolysaccharide export system permease protein
MLGVIVSLGMIWLNDVAITWGASGMQTVIAESVEEVVFRLLKTERSFRNKHIEIYVKQVRGRTLIEPRLKVRRGDYEIIAHAREAELETDLQTQTLKVLLSDCSITTIGKDNHREVGFADAGTHEQQIPLSQATRKDSREPRVSELGLARISNEMVQQQANIRTLEQQLAARAAFQMITGNFSALGTTTKHADGQTWNGLHQQRRLSRSRLNRLRLEPWRRFAEGFSCLFIVMVGAPLAIRMKTNNFFTTFAMCFFPVLCLYYPVFQWTIEQVKEGSFPPYSVWLSNGVLSLIGGWLTRLIVRY